MENCNSVDFLKSAQFKLILEYPERHVEFFVQECNLPGWNLGEMEIPWMAQNQQRPGDNIQWNLLTPSILVDSELKSFKECYDYCARLKNPETGELGDFTQLFDAKLAVLTNKNNYQHLVTFYDAWIQNVSDIQLSHTTSEDDPMVFTIDIQYDYYKFTS